LQTSFQTVLVEIDNKTIIITTVALSPPENAKTVIICKVTRPLNDVKNFCLLTAFLKVMLINYISKFPKVILTSSPWDVKLSWYHSYKKHFLG